MNPYSDNWSSEFKDIGQKLKLIFNDNALAIHHIGSTSVPGLKAKDVIDVQVTVNDFDLIPHNLLEQNGFTKSPHERDHCPPGLTLKDDELEKRLYKYSLRMANIHIRKKGTFNQNYPLLFRDFLREHPMAANSYGEVKVQLAKYFPENFDAYYDIKDPVCDIIMAGAFSWAKKINWQQSPSDI